MSSEVILKLENVYKHFGGVKAVDGVDFEVSSNKITGLIGVSTSSTEKPSSFSLSQAKSLAPSIPEEKLESAETLG